MISFILEQFQNLFLGFINLFWGPAHQFKSPAWLLLILLIPIYLIWYYWWYDQRRLVVPLSYNPKEMVKSGGISWTFLRNVPMVLQIAAVFLMILALARPQSALETQERYSEGIDIMLVLDTSGSMETDDFKPNRLEVAKEMAGKFIKGRLDDRIGIVVFAEDAFSYAPLTLDYALLEKQIKSINSKIMPNRGTAVGSAISVAINRLEDSDSPSKIMILMTDGASNRGQIDPATAGKLAKDKGIKIYSIGIGKKEYQRRTMFGVQKIKSDLDEESLKSISDMTGGKFWRSTDEQSLDNIFQIISQMEKVEIVEETYRDETDLYPPLLFWALGFLSLAFIVMVTFLYNPLEG